MKIISFDFGYKYIGLAISQNIFNTHPYSLYIKSYKFSPNWLGIHNILLLWKPNLFIVGLPLNINATEQLMTRITKYFSFFLYNYFNINIFLYDERLTSAIFNGRNKFIRNNVHALSARLILINWLNDH